MALADITQTLFLWVAVVNALIGLGAILLLISYKTQPPFWDKLSKHFKTHGIRYGLAIATLATLGSLWLSEISGIPPCRLCWFQRIAMYPLIVVLGVGALKKRSQARLMGLILSGIGFIIAGYHYLVQQARFWQVTDMNAIQHLITNGFELLGMSLQAPGCAVEASCSVMYLGYWGFYSIPLFAMISFFGIFVALSLSKKQ